MIRIAHLYYDLMNLYGESGNIKALCYELENQKIKFKVDRLSIGDKIDFSKYDFFYMGSGTSYNQCLVSQDLVKYKEDIKIAIDQNKFFLLTGNALELLGKKIFQDKEIGLQIFDYCAITEEKRTVSEVIAKHNDIKLPILGFQNRDSKIVDNSSYLFKITYGTGFSEHKNQEGVSYKNVLGTYIIGPVLARNPHFLQYVIKKLILQKNIKFKFKKFNLDLEKKAYDNYLENYQIGTNMS